MLDISVCVSGGGTNLQAIIDAIAAGRITDTRIVSVVSNNPGAYALTRARDAGIKTAVIKPSSYPDRAAFNEALTRYFIDLAPGLIVMAGFMVQAPEALITAFKGRIINIHPALIPSFCGRGYYGLRVHEAALSRGVKVTGATVHYASAGLDEGPIIAQKAVDVLPGDTPESLQHRVMEQAEWVILPQAIDDIAHGRVVFTDSGSDVT